MLSTCTLPHFSHSHRGEISKSFVSIRYDLKLAPVKRLCRKEGGLNLKSAIKIKHKNMGLSKN